MQSRDDLRAAPTGPAQPLHEPHSSPPPPSSEQPTLLDLAHLHPVLGPPSLSSTEPLKVCLDDDSSLEDGDEDMFDDDAFAFGDEDFAALMSHEGMRRMAQWAAAAQIAGQPPAAHYHAAQQSASPLHASPPSHGAFATPSAPQHPQAQAALPSASFPMAEKASSMPSLAAADSLPSTAASSIASLGTLTLTSAASCASLPHKAKSKRRVSLHADVTVVPIPSRQEYPHPIRERLWSTAAELHRNAARNAVEFASEGFDWRNAVDDARMVRSAGGERIHPVHYVNLLEPAPHCVGDAGACAPEAAPASVGMDVEMEPLRLPS